MALNLKKKIDIDWSCMSDHSEKDWLFKNAPGGGYLVVLLLYRVVNYFFLFQLVSSYPFGYARGWFLELV